MRSLPLFIAALLLAATAHAADPAKKPLVDAPPPPTVVDQGADTEPEVTIRKDGDKRVEEFRLHGRLYMIKVTPVVGPSYYLMDEDGSGTFKPYDPRGEKLVVPRWILFRF